MNHRSLLCFTVETIAPEEVIFKLKRERIPLYHLQKREKNALELCVERKYRKKVFTILENSCYNIKSIRKFGFSRIPDFLKKKAGMLIGCPLFLLSCILADSLVLRIDVQGGNYREEVTELLAGQGVGIGKPYAAELAPVLTAQILALPEVAFCSVKKVGSVLRIEIRRQTVLQGCERGKSLYASRAGRVTRITVLRGRASVGVGTDVDSGELLAEPDEDGILMASVELYCEYREVIRTDSEEKAYAAGRFAAGEDAVILGERLTPVPGGFLNETEYSISERINM